MDTLAARIFLILVAGVLLALAITAQLRHREQLTWLRRAHLIHSADQIERFWRILQSVPPEQRMALIQDAPKLGLHLQPPPGVPKSPDVRLDQDLALLLTQRMGPGVLLGVDRGYVRLLLSDGRVLGLQTVPPEPPPAPRLHFWLLEGFFLLCLLVLAAVVAGLSTRPLSRLARAAQLLQQDLQRPPLEESGPREIRQAVAAFNDMQSQLVRQLQTRSQMLAAISHDLQTPLTRLRLRLEKVEDRELREKLLGDLALMQQLVRQGLDLARSVDFREEPIPVDLYSMLDSLVQDTAAAGGRVRLLACEPYPEIRLRTAPTALRRCLDNLVENAVKYSEEATLEVVAETHQVTILIADSGPGLSPELLERVFEPFCRAENSRSRETGGTGLGLTITRNLASRQGGQVWLENLPQGGLRACLRWPRVP